MRGWRHGFGRARSGLNRRLRQLLWWQAHRAAAGRRIGHRQIAAEILKVFGQITAGFANVSQGTADTVQLTSRTSGALNYLLALGKLLSRFGATRSSLRTFRSGL